MRNSLPNFTLSARIRGQKNWRRSAWEIDCPLRCAPHSPLGQSWVNEDIFHIGLRYIPDVHPGEWVWLDGTKANYTHWYTAPNPAFGKCAQASLERDGGRWYPEPCGVVKRPSVCELPLSSDVEPLPETGPKSECKDSVASWKCASLKTLQACNAAQYFK